MWLGYYENAFRLVRECYAGDRPAPHRSRLARSSAGTTRSAPRAAIGLGELHDGEWLPLARASSTRTASCRASPTPTARPMSRGRARAARAAAAGRLRRLVARRAGPRASAPSRPAVVLSTQPDPARRALRPGPRQRGRVGLAADAALVAALAAICALSSVRRVAGPARRSPRPPSSLERGRRRGDPAAHRTRRACTRRRRRPPHLAVPRPRARDRPRHRRRRLMDRPEGYAAVDDEDYRDWLRAPRREPRDHRVAARAGRVRPRVRVRARRRPRVRGSPPAPGLLLSGKMFFDYRGAIFWKMTAGMGDVVFAPLYDALRARGVRVPVLPSGRPARARVTTGTGSTPSTSACRRSSPTGPRSYEPLVDVGGLRVLAGVAAAHELSSMASRAGYGPDDFESIVVARRPTSARSVTLRAGTDFDAWCSRSPSACTATSAGS